MSTTSTVVVSLTSIATDLGLHIWNYGVPMPQEVGFFGSEKGLALAGTVTGISATAIAGGITSGELDSMVASIPSAYNKKLARTMIASSVINVKMLSQAGVCLAYSMVTSRENFGKWASSQFIPSLFVHGAIAGIVPYWMN
jgi:hypothetical protein